MTTLAVREARAAGFALEGRGTVADAYDPARAFRLVEPPPPDPPAPKPLEGVPPANGKRPGRATFDRKTAYVFGGTLILTGTAGYFAWWQASGRRPFHSAREGWFEETSYAGGADKVSHVFVGYAAEHFFEEVYGKLGKTDRQSRLLSLVTVASSGLLVELGDGYSQYGYAWQDAASNLVGAAIAAGIREAKLEDTLGLRYGLVKTLKPDLCCRYGGYGSDYSNEIYTLDLKWNGLAPRLGSRPGPLRFLLTSVSYGSKGYRYSPEDHRQRNVGIELGLNVEEVLKAIGVRPGTWWGTPLLLLGRYFRFPYTAFGMFYDMNQGRWHGIHTGDRFDPGSIFYD